MALIAICICDTESNGRFKYTKECLESLCETVDFNLHRVFLINNGSSAEVTTYLKAYRERHNTVTLINLETNIGTAAGINLALALRNPDEVCIKMDNDVVVHNSGWVEEMERVLSEHPEIGILGLKREDVYGEFMPDGELLWCKDIMGTCTAYSPAMLDKVGYLSQPSCYGYDDVLMSVRSICAGFKNAFLPAIKITHLDEGGTDYTNWKKKEASVYLQEVGIMCDMYREGKLNYYYDGGFND